MGIGRGSWIIRARRRRGLWLWGSGGGGGMCCRLLGRLGRLRRWRWIMGRGIGGIGGVCVGRRGVWRGGGGWVGRGRWWAGRGRRGKRRGMFRWMFVRTKGVFDGGSGQALIDSGFKVRRSLSQGLKKKEKLNYSAYSQSHAFHHLRIYTSRVLNPCCFPFPFPYQSPFPHSYPSSPHHLPIYQFFTTTDPVSNRAPSHSPLHPNSHPSVYRAIAQPSFQ